jgi:hypothetical protein
MKNVIFPNEKCLPAFTKLYFTSIIIYLIMGRALDNAKGFLVVYVIILVLVLIATMVTPLRIPYDFGAGAAIYSAVSGMIYVGLNSWMLNGFGWVWQKVEEKM